MDRDAAIYSLELERCAALAYVGVDVTVDPALNGDREADRDAAVHCLCHQVGGIVLWSSYRNAAIR